jgi:Xaa-Pro aminopeptidase
MRRSSVSVMAQVLLAALAPAFAGDPPAPSIPLEEYRARREKVIEALSRDPRGILVLRREARGGPRGAAWGRTDADLIYLTGIEDGDAALLLAGREIDGGREVILPRSSDVEAVLARALAFPGAFRLEPRRAAELIAPLRQVKSPAEIARIRLAAAATCAAQRRAMRAVRPGVLEADIAAAIDAEYRGRGARAAFPSIVGSGPNGCIPHYARYDRALQAGDLVVMDLGAEVGLYAADVTRTVPATGRFVGRGRRIYGIVLEAQEAALRAIRPGAALEDVDRAARHAIASGLIGLGLIENGRDVGKYLTHFTSHGIGLDVHDPTPRVLEAGMTITVEPAVYIREEGIGVRIEDDVLVTPEGREVLTGDAPKRVEEIEAWMRTREF